MEAVIIQGCMLLVAFATIVINLYLDIKQKKLNVITQARNKKYELIRELSGKFSSSVYLSAKTKDKIYYADTIKYASFIRAQLTFSFEVDRKLINMMNKLVLLLECEIIEENRIFYELEEFTHIIDVYSATEWNRIKTETVKSKKDKFPNEWFYTFEKNLKHNMEVRKGEIDPHIFKE